MILKNFNDLHKGRIQEIRQYLGGKDKFQLKDEELRNFRKFSL